MYVVDVNIIGSIFIEKKNREIIYRQKIYYKLVASCNKLRNSNSIISM